MHACGNDYVYFVNPFKSDEQLKNFAVFASDRHKGIGSDGIITLSRSDTADVKTRMFNADGSEGSICGNGVRCAALFATKYTGVAKNVVNIETNAGIVEVKLDKAEKNRAHATAAMPAPKTYIDSEKLARVMRENGFSVSACDVFAINAGNEHLVVTDGELSAAQISEIADESGLFTHGVNVEKCVATKDGVYAEVYERGSGYTLSCGSGAVAIAYAFYLKDGSPARTITTDGGTLSVRLTQKAAYLSGEVAEIYHGEIDLEL